MTDLIAALVAREREARDNMELRSYWSDVRRQTLLDLHEALGTWQKVADATGQKLPTVHKAAMQPKKGTTP